LISGGGSKLKTKYEAISKAHYLDKQTFKIVEKSRLKTPNIIEYPYYLSSSNKKSATGLQIQNGVLKNDFNISEESSSLMLNNLRIDYDKKLCMYTIEFYDSRQKSRHTIKIHDLEYKTELTGTTFVSDFNISFDGSEPKFFSYIIKDPLFKLYKIRNLTQKEVYSSINSSSVTLNTGLLGTQYNIEFRGRRLDGKCYCFLNKQWGILLQDNLSFDALFFVEGCYSGNRIEVKDFIYTSNPYLIKCMMLWKES
jgi:hypothetical protein